MMKKVHARNRTDAASNDGKHKKSGFRNSPDMFLCLVFIYAHDNKADAINYNKINNK